MTHEEKKVAKIVEELTMFFFTIGGNKMQSGIDKEGDDVEITFSSNYEPEFAHSIEKLEEYLNEPKNAGIEDMYWELAGSGDPGETSQLLLVGMMIDRFEMKKTTNHVDLKLYKRLWG